MFQLKEKKNHTLESYKEKSLGGIVTDVCVYVRVCMYVVCVHVYCIHLGGIVTDVCVYVRVCKCVCACVHCMYLGVYFVILCVCVMHTCVESTCLSG